MLGYLGQITGSAAYGTVPERVRRAVAEQQDRSEQLISWIQLAVGVIFAVLYAVSPKTFDPGSMFEPVPWALAAYLLFTLARLLLALTRRLPQWFLYLSAIADIGLLLALIWSFHLQYEQPAAFYLKAPTAMYAFIFVALRALQFRARFVLLTGLAGSVGWLTLVWLAIEESGESAITRDYVHYMTSNSVLLGAEFDKVISIIMVTAILAVAMVRARSLLVRSVVESEAAADLSRFVPEEVVRQAKTGEHRPEAGHGEVREATILFMDMEGFTSLSETLSPAALIATLNEYFEVVTKPIVSHGGVIEQFQGDGVLATFNVPDPLNDHAAAAVDAALEVHRALAAHAFHDGTRLRARIGINTGVVVGGYVGTGDRLAYTVHGDEVNLAARLEQMNRELGTRLLVSEATASAAGKTRHRFRRIGNLAVRGRRREAEVYSVDPTPAA